LYINPLIEIDIDIGANFFKDFLIVAYSVKKQRHGDGDSSVDPDVYFQTMMAIRSLKPPEAPVKMAEARRRAVAFGKEPDRESQIRLSSVKRGSGEGTREEVKQRWRRAVAAAVAASNRSKTIHDKQQNVNASTGL